MAEATPMDEMAEMLAAEIAGTECACLDCSHKRALRLSDLARRVREAKKDGK